MKGYIAIFVGVVAGLSFAAGWMLDPGPQTTVVTSLVCGIGAILAQMSTRDLLAKAQTLIERGIDDLYTDGGEMLDHARVARDRLEGLALVGFLTGVLAPTCATLRTIYPSPFFSSAAFAFASSSVCLAIFLFFANRDFAALLEADRIRRVREKNRREALGPAPALNPVPDPNLKGYKIGGAARPIESHS